MKKEFENFLKIELSKLWRGGNRQRKRKMRKGKEVKNRRKHQGYGENQEIVASHVNYLSLNTKISNQLF
jgi:hypothetical protein